MPGRFTLREEKSGKETFKNVFIVPDVSLPSGAVRREYILHESLVSFFAPESRPTIGFSILSGLQGPNFLACKLAGTLVRRE